MEPLNLSDQDKWKNYGGFSPVITLFENFHHLSDEIKKLIDEQTFPVLFKKNKYVISPLENCHFLYLLTKGIVRGFYKEGKSEITTWIETETTVVGSIDNLWLDKDSQEYLQALEDCELVAIPHTLSEYLYANYPEANLVGRKMMEIYYRAAEERAYLCRMSSAEKRYLRFLENYPSLINRVALKYIASFLCMRLETLSRIRSKLHLP